MAHVSERSAPVRNSGNRAKPVITERGEEIQKYGQLVPMRIESSPAACTKSVATLNQILADTMTIRDLYKKHHWQIAGPTFHQLHLLFDKHYTEQNELVDQIAERIQLLGGVSVATAADVAETTSIERPPKGREEVSAQISRLLGAHELILLEARDAAKDADDAGDCGTNDLLVSNVVRTNEFQVWFLSEHLVPVRLVEATPE